MTTTIKTLVDSTAGTKIGESPCWHNGVESPPFAFAGHHFTLAIKDDDNVGLGSVVGWRLRPSGERDSTHSGDGPEVAHLSHRIRRRAYRKLTVLYVSDAEVRLAPFVRIDHREFHRCFPFSCNGLSP
jgi:hypothetical protein